MLKLLYFGEKNILFCHSLIVIKEIYTIVKTWLEQQVHLKQNTVFYIAYTHIIIMHPNYLKFYSKLKIFGKTIIISSTLVKDKMSRRNPYRGFENLNIV